MECQAGWAEDDQNVVRQSQPAARVAFIAYPMPRHNTTWVNGVAGRRS
jgi:hypothetical protein